MTGYKLRVLGITVAEIVCIAPEAVLRIDNTGGQFELAEGALSSDFNEDDLEYEEEDLGFGFRGASV